MKPFAADFRPVNKYGREIPSSRPAVALKQPPRVVGSFVPQASPPSLLLHAAPGAFAMKS